MTRCSGQSCGSPASDLLNWWRYAFLCGQSALGGVAKCVKWLRRINGSICAMYLSPLSPWVGDTTHVFAIHASGCFVSSGLQGDFLLLL